MAGKKLLLDFAVVELWKYFILLLLGTVHIWSFSLQVQCQFEVYKYESTMTSTQPPPFKHIKSLDLFLLFCGKNSMSHLILSTPFFMYFLIAIQHLIFSSSTSSSFSPPCWALYRFEGQISGKNIEIGVIGTDRKFRYALSGTFSLNFHMLVVHA